MNKKRSLIIFVLETLLHKEFQSLYVYFYSTTNFATVIVHTTIEGIVYRLDPIVDNIIAKRITIRQAVNYISKEIHQKIKKLIK